MATNTVKMTFAYSDDSTRQYTFGCKDSALIDVEDNINDINSSLSAGTDGGLKSFFVSAGGASFVKIKAASIISEEETVLNLGGE